MKTAAVKPMRLLLTCGAGAALLMIPGLALAANGITLTGFGSDSAGLAGVDLAVARDVTALNTNPAGLAQLGTQAMDIYLEPFYTLDNAHEDSFNRKRDVDNRFGAILGGGYSRPFRNGELVAAIGLFAQGGLGYVYEDLNTAFGTRDDFTSIFGIFKLTPGLAWRVNDHLRLGAALGINYGSGRQKLFPDTSVFDAESPEEAFFGTRLDGLKGFGFNGKLGVQYQPLADLTLALTYTSKIPLNLDGGSLTVNYDAIGLGRVKYRDAGLQGLALPQELGLGATYRWSPRWMIGAEFNWLDYSGAITSLTLTANDPSNPEAPVIPPSVQAIDFRDVYVYAVAVERRWNDKTLLHAGYSHANTGVPRQNLSPTFALINKNVAAAGLSTELGPQWKLGVALEYQVRNQVSYVSATLPFGDEAREINQALLLTLMLSRRW